MTRLERLMDRARSGGTVLIDGGTGSECERRGVPVLDGAWSGSAALSHPEILRQVHADHVAAGAEVIIANTFSTHRHALEAAGVGADFETYNRRAVELAVEARAEAGADDVVVAAGIRNWTWTGPHPGLEELRRQSVEQAAVMASAGAELLILEMMHVRALTALRQQEAHRVTGAAWSSCGGAPTGGQICWTGRAR